MRYTFPLATSTWDQLEYAAMQRVIESDQFTMSEEVSAFEAEFARYFGSKFSVMVNSGSSANLLMIASLFYTDQTKYRLKRGDEVIVPAISWSTTYYPLAQYGLKLIFVDVDPKTLNFDLNALKNAITDKTRMIFAVNLLGNPNDFDAIKALIGGGDIILLEDNCESMGAQFNDCYTGTFGLMGSFSSFFSHHISTMEGGVIITNDEELYHILLVLRAHGWTRNLPNVNMVTKKKSNNDFEESFRFILPGYNLRPLEFCGAVGREQLKKLPGIVNGRRRNAERFLALFEDNPIFHVQEEVGASSWFGFSMIVRKSSPWNREQIITQLNKMGFECRPIVAGNFAKNKVVELMDYSIPLPLQNADFIDQNGLFIGNHHYDMTNAFDVLGSLESNLKFEQS